MYVTRANRTINYVSPEEWMYAKGVTLGLLVGRIKELQAERKRKFNRPTPRSMCFGYKELSESVARLIGIKIDYEFDLAHLVGELSEEQERAGRGMISAFVVVEPDNPRDDVSPGAGFFQFAHDFGSEFTD